MEFRVFQTTFTSHINKLYKRLIILVTFLAYSLTLVHSLVPHHHHDKAITHYHHHGDGLHHHHGDPDEHDEKTIGHIFADAAHHPASELVIHPPESQRIQKNSNAVDLFIVKSIHTIFLRIRPPDPLPDYQAKHYSSDQDSFFLLRAPPVV